MIFTGFDEYTVYMKHFQPELFDDGVKGIIVNETL
jgi:hypothetical protein